MDFLKGNNKTVSGEINTPPISAREKHVIVIGGGDTGSDCIGTSIRHGALSVSNFEIMPQGTPERPAHQPWPFYPMRLKTSTSHKEGAERFFSISTKEFVGDAQGNLTGLKTVQVAWEQVNGRMELKEVPGSEKVWQADLVLLAMGFTGSEPTIAEQLGVAMDARTNIQATEADYKTNVPGVFAAGDQRRGQ